MKTLTDPSILAFTQAIHDVGGGIVSDRWIASAFTAAWDWIRGNVVSAPYGANKTPLLVAWQWANGVLTVTISR